jgi:signal transduction histidine kinase
MPQQLLIALQSGEVVSGRMMSRGLSRSQIAGATLLQYTSSSVTHEPFAGAIAARMHADRQALAQRWLGRLSTLVPVPASEVFPTETLLDHIPLLIEEVAKFIAAPEKEIAANTFVVAKARELGELRHEQHASVHQLLREYELLRNILEAFVVEQAQHLRLSPPLLEVVGCLRRINQSIAILTQTTVDTFIERYTATIADQTNRLESFNQMMSHELRQPLSALSTAAALLEPTEGDGEPERRGRVVAAIQRNVARLMELVANITRISSIHAADATLPGVQRVSVSAVAHEAARQLREMAQDRGVEVVVGQELPDVIVDVGRLELLLTNLLSNAIKYSDPAKSRRFVEVAGAGHDAECGFHVRDNGLGMTSEQLRHVFTPFYRAHAGRDAELRVEGLGLGLAIVRDCAQAIGASIEVDAAPAEGATFTVTLPKSVCASPPGRLA